MLRVIVKQILRCLFKVMGHKMSGFVHKLAVTTSTPNPFNVPSLWQGRGCPPSPRDYFTSLTHFSYLSFFLIVPSKMYGHTKNPNWLGHLFIKNPTLSYIKNPRSLEVTEHRIFEMSTSHKASNITLALYDSLGVYFIHHLFKTALREGHSGIWMWVNI